MSNQGKRGGRLRWLRARLKRALFDLVRRILETNEGRNLVVDSLREQFSGRLPDLGASGVPSPYPGLGAVPPAGGMEGEGMILVTGRFRSGSTLLWNLFRHMKGFTAYYEPHNERRWFDP